MGRRAKAVKYCKASGPRPGYFYTSTKIGGTYQRNRLFAGADTPENWLRAYRLVNADEETGEPVLPKDLIVTVTPPKVRVIRRKPAAATSRGRSRAGRSGEHGVTVLVRYTLRLLTIQQFQRATALMCACEDIRRKALERGDHRWGDTPFRIGLWVGRRTAADRR